MSDKLNIEMLDSTNWYKWKTQMRFYMESKGLWNVVQDGNSTAVEAVYNAVGEDDEDMKQALGVKNSTALSLMSGTIKDPFFNIVAV